MRIITRWKKWRARRAWDRSGHSLLMNAGNNFTRDITFQAVLQNWEGDMILAPFSHGHPTGVPEGFKVMEIRYPDINKPGTTTRGGKPRARPFGVRKAQEASADGEVATIRHELAYGSMVMENTEVMAATVAQALRKFNEMILLFRDFSFRSTDDSIYLRMDGKNYEILIKEFDRDKSDRVFS